MPDVNASFRRFENGGTLEINDGTARNVLNIVAGSLEWTPAFRERIYTKDRGTYNDPMLGDNTLSEITFRVRTGKFAASNEIYAILMQAGTGDAPKLFATTTVKIPDSKGAITGESLTWSNAWLAEPPRFASSAGSDEVDTMTFTLRCKSGPAAATY